MGCGSSAERERSVVPYTNSQYITSSLQMFSNPISARSQTPSKEWTHSEVPLLSAIFAHILAPSSYTQTVLRTPRPIDDAYNIVLSRINGAPFAIGVVWEMQYSPTNGEFEMLWDEWERKLAEVLAKQPRGQDVRYGFTGMGRWVRFYRLVPKCGLECLGPWRPVDLGKEAQHVSVLVREMAGS
ncbi:MAG: hypothetical protein M1828_003688 [Chrysothrix sp. TS-e1954]|nr:MAG: hypothetical protein M1828_003688 [Chrysothrix sp. TS-e1954]